MPPPLLFSLDDIDLNHIELGPDQVYTILPHRFEFSVLSGVCLIDRERHRLVAFADVRPDAWWIRGHIPQRTLLPGALMLEMAGQASGVGAKVLAGFDGFLGFGGVDECKFRETVVPPARLYLLIQGVDYRPRRIVSRTQGVIDGRIIFEATITGVPIR
jgi:3-hydroxyacyl-[acyl-carrier-protein] dehydratase